MADGFDLEVATPERLMVQEHVSDAQIPVCQGYIGVLAGHAPLLAELATAGVLSYHRDGRNEYLSILGGFVEVLPDKVRVLADAAERAEEIDLPTAKEELNRVHKQMEALPVDADPAMALSELLRAQARVEAAEKKGKAG